jgi:hypothetical protein
MNLHDTLFGRQAVMEYWEGTPGYSRSAARVTGVHGCCGMAEGL